MAKNKNNRQSSIVNRQSTGFTIVELLVAMSLLVILLGLSSMVFKTTVAAHRAAGAAIDVTRNLRAITDQLEQSRESDPSNRDVSYWLAAAYVATGQTDLARDFTREARMRFTHDADITTLYALVLFRDGDLAGAERELRRALGLEPDNAVAALNLGIVLLEADRDGEANTLLTGVADRHSDEPIGERARSILAAHAHD